MSWSVNIDQVKPSIFNQDPNLGFLKAFENYFNDQAKFSSKSMGLEMMQHLYADQVSCPTTFL
jgi:hypothetical protein